MLAGVAGLGAEMPPKTLPVPAQFWHKLFNFLNRYSPALGSVQVFFIRFICSVLPRLLG